MRHAVALICGQMAIGAAAIFGRYALHGTHGLCACALRLSLASVLVWGVSRRRPRAALSSRQGRWLIGAGCVLALHFATWVYSLALLPVALSSLLVSTSPLWNTLYETVLLRRPPPLRFWLALVFATAGTALMLDPGAAAWGTHNRLGAVSAVLGALCMCAYVIIIARVHHDRLRTACGPLDVGSVVLRTYSTCAALLIVLCMLARLPPPPLHDFQAWGGLLLWRWCLSFWATR